MEEILASIRRILNDDDGPAAPPEEPESVEADDDVLVLDESMEVAPGEVAAVEVAAVERVAEIAAAAPVVARPAPKLEQAPEPPGAEPRIPETREPAPRVREPTEPAMEAVTSSSRTEAWQPPAPTPELLAPGAAAAAASSVGSLVKALAAGRAAQVYSGGPTLEDMVRAEMRPLLKEWLDLHLPAMVERLVRLEIERVAGHAGS